MISAHCPICANQIEEVSPKAALLWIELVTILRNPSDIIVTRKPLGRNKHFKILEELGYVLTHENRNNFLIKVNGGDYDKECVFFCIDETCHGCSFEGHEDDNEAEEMY